MSQTTNWPIGLGQAIGARVTQKKTKGAWLCCIRGGFWLGIVQVVLGILGMQMLRTLY